MINRKILSNRAQDALELLTFLLVLHFALQQILGPFLFWIVDCLPQNASLAKPQLLHSKQIGHALLHLIGLPACFHDKKSGVDSEYSSRH